MTEVNGKWHETWRVMTSMTDASGQLTLPAMCNVVQEVAGNHAAHHRFGLADMQARRLFWVLHRLRLEVVRPARWKDDFEVVTWVCEFKGSFSHRNFLFRTPFGENLASASTSWALLDAGSRRPARLPANDFDVFNEEKAPCGFPERVEIPTALPCVAERTASYFDLDLIDHVNNVRYIEWLLHTTPLDFRRCQPALLEVNFMGEVNERDTVQICCTVQDGLSLHHLTKAGQSILKARVLWQVKKK
jgi:acyl-ACP thioesterase